MLVVTIEMRRSAVFKELNDTIHARTEPLPSRGVGAIVFTMPIAIGVTPIVSIIIRPTYNTQSMRTLMKDGASLFKQRSLQAIETRRRVEKVLKVSLVVLAIVMALAVVASQFIM